MNSLKEAEARVISAREHHRRLCVAHDEGAHNDVALTLAHTEWVAARAEYQRIKSASAADGVVASVLMQQHNADAPGDVA